MLRQIEVVQTQGARVTEGTGRKKEFDRFALLGNKNMNAQPIKIAFFAWLVATPGLALVDFQALGATMAAHSNRVAVNDIHRFFVELLPPLAETQKQGQEQVRNLMQPTIETTPAQHLLGFAVSLGPIVSGWIAKNRPVKFAAFGSLLNEFTIIILAPILMRLFLQPYDSTSEKILATFP